MGRRQRNVLKISIVACGLLLPRGYASAQTGDAAGPNDAVPAQTASSAQPEFKPLTQGQRFHHFVTGTFSVEAVLRAAAGAAILQETNTPSEWGQGGIGYARRFQNSYAQHIMRQTMMYGAADLLDEDNRYLPSERSGIGPRFGYAVESTFLARRDDGTRRLSYFRLGSIVAVAFISREWQPHSTNGAQNAGMNIGTVVGSEVGFNIAREFFPRVFHHH
jgi:hypothetical protein